MTFPPFHRQKLHKSPKPVALSKAGILYVFLTIAIGISAVNTGNNMLFLLTSLLLSLMGISGITALINLQKLSVQWPTSQLLTRSATDSIQITIKNHRSWSAWLLEIRLGEERVGISRIAPHGSETISLPWHADSRGPVPLPTLLLGSSFPFSFVWRAKILPQLNNHSIWATATSTNSVDPPSHAQAGDESHDPKEGYGDLLFLREKLPTEPLYRVLWRRSDWRNGFNQPPKLPVLIRESETQPIHIIDYQDWPNLPHEERLQRIRSAVQNAANQGKRWQLRINTLRINGYREQGVKDALWAIARMPPFSSQFSSQPPSPSSNA